MHIQTTQEDLDLLKKVNITGDWSILKSFKQKFLFQRMLYFKITLHPERKERYLKIIKDIAYMAKEKINSDVFNKAKEMFE